MPDNCVHSIAETKTDPTTHQEYRSYSIGWKPADDSDSINPNCVPVNEFLYYCWKQTHYWRDGRVLCMHERESQDKYNRRRKRYSATPFFSF